MQTKFANPRRSYRFWLHREHLTKNVDLGTSLGLEIGAFDLPLVEPDEGSCEFADFRSVDQLKLITERLSGHSTDFTVPIKYDLRNGYDQIQCRYDWIAAAHVIEHIPNLISWLNILTSKLKDNGIIFFVIPDKRYTYDYHRRTTVMSDVVEWHRQDLKTPSYQQVFDHHFFSTQQLDPGLVWGGAQIPAPLKNYVGAHAAAQRALTGFEDAHCSVFTPESFVELINDLSNASLIHLKLEDVRSTQLNQLDFTAIIRPLRR